MAATEELAGAIRVALQQLKEDPSESVTAVWLWKVMNRGSQPSPALVRAFAEVSLMPLGTLYEAAGYPQADRAGLEGLYLPLIEELRVVSPEEQRRFLELWRLLREWESGRVPEMVPQALRIAETRLGYEASAQKTYTGPERRRERQ